MCEYTDIDLQIGAQGFPGGAAGLFAQLCVCVTLPPAIPRLMSYSVDLVEGYRSLHGDRILERMTITSKRTASRCCPDPSERT